MNAVQTGQSTVSEISPVLPQYGWGGELILIRFRLESSGPLRGFFSDLRSSHVDNKRFQSTSLKNHQVRFSVMSRFSVKVHALCRLLFSFVAVYSDIPNLGLLYLNAIKSTSK